jgi:cold shock protein
MPDNTRLRGKVRWFNEIQGYGVILLPDGRDVFVHYKDIAGEGFRTLSENEIVEFEIKTGRQGLHAFNVEKVNQGDNVGR